MGLRITEEEELIGVDIVEHGAHAYNDFQGIK
jgi:ammonia channel protein AmtB